MGKEKEKVKAQVKKSGKEDEKNPSAANENKFKFY